MPFHSCSQVLCKQTIQSTKSYGDAQQPTFYAIRKVAYPHFTAIICQIYRKLCHLEEKWSTFFVG